jgi:hypothetical protein
MATDKLTGTASTNAYGDTNTQSYEDTITQQYKDLLAQRDTTTDAAIEQAESGLGVTQRAGERGYDKLLSQAQTDRAESKATKSALEQASGNRQKIGSTQYDIADQTYDQQRAAIYQARAQLQKDTARQLSDLQAQGEYEKADALLAAKQQELQQIYEDALRADTNLRGNYEYQVGLQREDEEIQREQEETDKSWLRSIGEMFLQKGVMPTDSSLEAMGIDQATAQLYIDALGYGSGYSSGSSGSSGSSSGSSKSSGSSTTTNTTTEDTNSGTTTAYTRAYTNSTASAILKLANEGNYSGAISKLNQAYYNGEFSGQNYTLLHKQISSKMNSDSSSNTSKTGTSSSGSTSKTGTSGVKTTDYWTKYYG